MKYSITIISLLLLAAGVQAKDCTSPDPSVNLANGFVISLKTGPALMGKGKLQPILFILWTAKTYPEAIQAPP